jgi:hypothetical protein
MDPIDWLQDINWGELHMGTGSIFAAAGSSRSAGPRSAGK